MLQVGDVIGGRLRIDRMLGMGGFGVVAAATHLELRHEVAVKMIRPELVDDAEIVDRFLREARAVAGLRTDHVCRVFDIGRTEQGAPFIVMELLRGTDVAAILRTQALPPATAVDYIQQACAALAEAHPRGIVHRDLKPPNLFVVRRPDGSSLVKVLDFGIAKAVDELRLTHSSVVLGSPQYMSPEQLVTPKDVDARTDIWSLGVTLYHMLARRLPFPSAQTGELAVMITSKPPAPIDEIDPGLRAVIWRCLEKDRAARFQDVHQLLAALAPFGPTASRAPAYAPAPVYAPAAQNHPTMSTMVSGAAPAPLAPAHAPAPAAPPARSRALLFGALAVVLVGGGAVIGYLALSSSSSKKPAPPTTTPVAVASSPDAAMLDAPVVIDAMIDAAMIDAAIIDAAMIDAAPIRVAVVIDAAPRAQHSQFELELAKIEGRISATPPSAPEIPDLYLSAAQMACIIKDADKAKQYFGKLVDAGRKQRVIDACRPYNIDL